MSRRDTDPNRGNRRIPLTYFPVADLLGLNDSPARPDAPELSAAERQFLDRPDAPEALRERVAVAITEARDTHGFGFPCPCGWEAGFGQGWERRLRRHRELAVADAALAVVRGETS